MTQRSAAQRRVPCRTAPRRNKTQHNTTIRRSFGFRLFVASFCGRRTVRLQLQADAQVHCTHTHTGKLCLCSSAREKVSHAFQFRAAKKWHAPRCSCAVRVLVCYVTVVWPRRASSRHCITQLCGGKNYSHVSRRRKTRDAAAVAIAPIIALICAQQHVADGQLEPLCRCATLCVLVQASVASEWRPATRLNDHSSGVARRSKARRNKTEYSQCDVVRHGLPAARSFEEIVEAVLFLAVPVVAVVSFDAQRSAEQRSARHLRRRPRQVARQQSQLVTVASVGSLERRNLLLHLHLQQLGRLAGRRMVLRNIDGVATG